MPRKRFRLEEIITKLREADVLGQGKRVAEDVGTLGVSKVKLRGELLGWEVFRSLGEAGPDRALAALLRPHPAALGPAPSAAGTRGRAVAGWDAATPGR
jgi:hypothetical protein